MLRGSLWKVVVAFLLFFACAVSLSFIYFALFVLASIFHVRGHPPTFLHFCSCLSAGKQEADYCVCWKGNYWLWAFWGDPRPENIFRWLLTLARFSGEDSPSLLPGTQWMAGLAWFCCPCGRGPYIQFAGPLWMWARGPALHVDKDLLSVSRLQARKRPTKSYPRQVPGACQCYLSLQLN